MIFTFWEGPMPDYIKLCMKTWKFPYVVLNYSNLAKYAIDVPEKIKHLSLPKIADYVRVHILRDNGGHWLDADTIMLKNELPKEMILGNNETRSNTIGFLYAEKPHLDLFERWAKFQDEIVKNLKPNDITNWDVFGNAFTDTYFKTNSEIAIGTIAEKWPETRLDGDMPRRNKYENFYFKQNHSLNDITNTSMLMLHNSWTPQWFKTASEKQVLNFNCTLSNILKALNESDK